ncbi:MAG: 30S ribosome-binding factor RbfA [Chloroflexota bacterium]
MASTIRQQRVNRLLQHEISSLLEFEVDDPRLVGITVSAVEVSSDLTHARVFIVAVGDAKRAREIRQGLRHAIPFLRRELGQRIQLRVVPDFDFAFDDSMARAARVEELLREVLAPTSTSDVSETSEVSSSAEAQRAAQTIA